MTMFSTPAKILSNKYFEPTVFQIYVSVNFIWKKYFVLTSQAQFLGKEPVISTFESHAQVFSYHGFNLEEKV